MVTTLVNLLAFGHDYQEKVPTKVDDAHNAVALHTLTCERGEFLDLILLDYAALLFQ